jgi:glycosyltransferase involved in cell wall biosynthesis
VRLAVFTNEFPSRVSTFFVRDVRGFIDAGFDIEIFPLRSGDEALWRFVPGSLEDVALLRRRTHHLTVTASARAWITGERRSDSSCRTSAMRAVGSGARFGVVPAIKTALSAAKARAWAEAHCGRFDHVLAYWGNYAATAACLFHQVAAPRAPFTMFLHAGVDLYRQRVYMREKLRYADNIIVVCDFNRRFLAETYPDLAPELAPKLHVHRLGLDLDALAFRELRPKTPTILAVGRFDRRKGFDVLLTAARRLSGRASFRLVLAGDGPEASRLEALARRLGIADRVEFPGWLTFDQVRQAMGEAWLLVHPSSGLGDAVPTVIKEAMAVGTPVVASRVAGIPELLDAGQCGVLVPPRNVEALSSAILTLLESPEARRDMAARARAFAELNFDAGGNCERLGERLRASVRTRTERPLGDATSTGVIRATDREPDTSLVR